MKIRCTRREVWWVVVQDRRGEITTYCFIWPMVAYWLEDQLGDEPKAVLFWKRFHELNQLGKT